MPTRTTPASTQPPPLPLQRVLERVLGWFLGEGLHLDNERLRRARLVVASALVFMVVDLLLLGMVDWTPAFRIGGMPLPRPVVSALFLAVVVHFSTAVLVQQERVDSAAFFLTASFIVFISFLAYLHGGPRAPITWWLAAVPIYAAFLSGWRHILASTTLVLTVLLGFHALQLTGHPFPHQPGGELARQQDVLMAQIILLTIVAFFGWYYERTRIVAQRDLVGAYNDLERINAALRLSQANVRQITEHVGKAIWMHDLRTDRVVYANAAFEHVFDLPRRDIAADARAWRRRILPEDVAAVPLEGPDDEQVYRLSVDGDVRWVRHGVSIVGDPQSSTHRAIHIAADVTLEQTAEALRERYLETVFEVAENERRHLARELHDNTGGSLTALLVGLRTLVNTLQRDDQRSLAGQLAEQLRTVVGDIQRLSRGLHPSVLDELGLVAAVGRLADDARDRLQLEVDVRVSGREHEQRLSPTERLAIYRIVQEALTNVARHAHAGHVDVDLSLSAERIAVAIEDDGVGFDPKAPERTHELSSGLGLMGMKERASLLGGFVDIESAPGRGTTVIGELPIDRRGERSPFAAR